MIKSFTPKMEILYPPQQRLWPELSPAADLGFVLYGGTAIALQLGHRSSVDFDFFTEIPLNRKELICIDPVNLYFDLYFQFSFRDHIHA